ncbi:MAG: hypothetical protein GEU98_16415 [Pseudonocardiaceae bacterium]|nr:hypothetical protein [Pseudonocardiaceae bacterium]
MSTLCVDVGSTWTKAALVSAAGEFVAGTQHPTTRPDVLDGVRAVTERLDAGEMEVLACSSAGGGLRLAVVGQERLISAEAGYRVALSAGAKVVHVAAGKLDGAGIRALRAAAPDVVLLTGGTDGGDEKVLLHNARRLAANRIRPPIVLAGNASAKALALAELRGTGRTVLACPNVLPDVGELAPEPARQAIREVFLRHVIGGKGLSRGSRFRRMVRAVTPDAVLAGVAALASARADAASSVLVVDVGGATTDVYSAVSGADDQPRRSVVLPPDRRTVEGDIGMRLSAQGLVAEAEAEGLLAAGETEKLATAAAFRASHVDTVVTDAAEQRLAELAAVLAIRRHLRLTGGLGPRGAGLLVASGGVFRHASSARLAGLTAALRRDPVLRPVLREAQIVVDRRYVLAPAGLLAEAGRTEAANRLLGTL